MNRVIIAKSAKETKKIAVRVAGEILKSSFFAPPSQTLRRAGKATKDRKKAVVIGLIGDLGSGKTVFTQGFAKGLGIKENVTSPTFVLERVYKLKAKTYKLFIHIDAYRIEKSKEIADLGFKDLIQNPRNIVLIEWADKIKSILPKDYIKIRFKHINKNKREIAIWKNKKKF